MLKYFQHRGKVGAGASLSTRVKRQNDLKTLKKWFKASSGKVHDGAKLPVKLTRAVDPDPGGKNLRRKRQKMKENW